MRHKVIQTQIVSFAANATLSKFQRIIVDSLETTTRAPNSLLIVDASKKVLVARNFFCQIKQLAVTETFSLGDLLLTVASYFDFKTGAEEFWLEGAATKIRSTLFDIFTIELRLTYLYFRFFSP